MATEEQVPPPFEAVHNVELLSSKDSKILSVSVYSGWAEITRLFKFGIKTGQNQVVVNELPSVMHQQSFKVEGRGAATIHDVTLSTIPSPPVPTTSPKLESLESELLKTGKALTRAQKALASLETYLGSLNAQHIEVTKLQDIVDNYDIAGEKLDTKITELEASKKKLEHEIDEEKKILAGPQGNNNLNLRATIGVFADFEGEVEIALIYAVRGATWVAGYDIRVDMQTKDKPVTLTYKGAITQDTGEDWTDVPITLETAAPTFGVGIPTLYPWTLTIYKPSVIKYKASRGSVRMPQTSALLGGGPPAGSSMAQAAEASRELALDMLSENLVDGMQHRGLHVSSRGNVNATFSVPGLMNIPSDGVAHNVTIVKLSLDATMEWVSVPKKDTKVHLKAVVKNASEYTLLSGEASVYVDGSFMSRSDVPLVSPEESFDCPLGLDPSIRVTYLPLSKKVSQSGFMSKSINYVYVQRITLQNTKSLAVENVKIVDQVPISEDAVINVKLISPPLDTSDNSTSSSVSKGAPLKGSMVTNKAGVRIPAPVTISQGVVAQWDGADDVVSQDGVESLGRDGKFNWTCSLAAQAKVNLTLQWEVSAPVRADISGL